MDYGRWEVVYLYTKICPHTPYRPSADEICRVIFASDVLHSGHPIGYHGLPPCLSWRQAISLSGNQCLMVCPHSHLGVLAMQ